MTASLQDIRSGNPNALVEWGEVRETIAKLDRLSNVLGVFTERMTKAKAWRTPANLQELVDETDSMIQELKSGPFRLGEEVPEPDGYVKFKDKPVPKATTEGVA